LNLSHLTGGCRRAGTLVLLAALAGVAHAAGAAGAADARPAPDNFFQDASMTGAELSPDGKSIAVALAATPKERVRLLVMDAQTLKASFTVVLTDLSGNKTTLKASVTIRA